MQKSSRELTDVNDRQKFPKNNFFNYRWRVLDNFSKSIDRHLFNLQAKISGNHTTLLSDRILQGYKASLSGSDSTTKNNELIGDLAQDAKQFLDQRKNDNRVNTRSEVLISKATTSLIQRTFKTLLAFSTELNSVLGLSELSVTATEPEVTRRAGKSETSHATCIQSSIFTGLFRLLIEGKDGTISFYMLPTTNILAMMDASNIYPPIATWNANFAAQDQVYWTTPDGILTEEMLERACAELIRRLVETTQEEIAPGYAAKSGNAENAVPLEVSEFSQADPWMQQAPAHTLSNDGTRTDSVPSLASLYKESGIFDAVDYDYATPSVQNFFEHKTGFEQANADASQTETSSKELSEYEKQFGCEYTRPFEKEPVLNQRSSVEPPTLYPAPQETVIQQKPALTPEPAIEQPPSYELKPAFQLKPTFEQKVFDKEIEQQQQQQQQQQLNITQSFTLAAERAPIVPPMIPAPPAVQAVETAWQSVESSNLDLNELHPGTIIGSSAKAKSKSEKTKTFDLKAEYYAETTKPVKAATNNKRSSRNKSNTRRNRKNKKK